MTRCGKFVGLGYPLALALIAQLIAGCGGRASDYATGSGNAGGASVVTAGGASGVTAGGPVDGASAGSAALPPPDGPFAVSQYFSPSLMGDGTTPGKISVDINDHCKTRPDGARGACFRFVYTDGDVQWGGAYWLTGGDNWGQDPGLSIATAGVHHVSFYAAEDGGMDNCQFFIGGIKGADAKPPAMYDDQFIEQSTQTLSSDWQKFDIDLPEPSEFQPPITSLLGAFGWAVNFSSSPDPATAPPKTIYIDDLVYE